MPITKRLLLVVALAFATLAHGQTSLVRTAPPAIVGAGTPTLNCTVGQEFFNTSATAGNNLYLCTAANTWTQLVGVSGQLYYTSFTVASAQVPSAQSNFTVALNPTDNRFRTVGNGGHVANSSGYDIRPYSDSGLTTPLTYELVPGTYNASTGTFEMWVLLTSVDVGSVIYIGYGDSTLSTDGSNPSGTWDSDFVTVVHLPDGSTLTATNSITATVGTKNGNVAAVAGKIDGGATFDGNGDNIDMGSENVVTTNKLTISCWLNPSVTSRGDMVTRWGNGADAQSQFNLLYGVTTGKPQLFLSTGVSVFNSGVGATSMSAGTWYMVHGRWTGSQAAVYLNGVSQSTGGSVTSLAAGALKNTIIGDNTAGDGDLNGLIDEVHVSKVDRSADWITTEYNNQSAPNTFWTIGSEMAH